MSHTPGPWAVCMGLEDGRHEPFAVTGGVEQFLVCNFPGDVWRDCPEARKANAALISAAPDMLDALENLENDNGQTMPPSAWAMVQAAIAKAKGER